MGLIKDMADKFFKGSKSRIDINDDGLDDYETRDKSLKALRRQRRRQIDLIEKERLRKSIDHFNRSQNRKILFDKGIMGVKNNGVIKSKKRSESFLCKGSMISKNNNRRGII